MSSAPTRSLRATSAAALLAAAASPNALAIITEDLDLDVNDLVGATRFYTEGYSGARVTLANVEAGHAWSGHESLGHVSRFVQSPNPMDPAPELGEFDLHATWASHAMGGRGTADVQRGIAFGADLVSGAIAVSYPDTDGNGNPVEYQLSFNTTLRSTIDPYAELMLDLSGGGKADVINSSWGFAEPTGANIRTAVVDDLIDQTGTVAVFSAGNSGPGSNTVGGISAGYNTITAAALTSELGTPFDAPASFSSRGPNDYFDPITDSIIDGVRPAVDLAAPGTDLVLAFYGGPTGGNRTGESLGGTPDGVDNFYSFGVAGTSFSAPIIAGGAGLIVDTGRDRFGGGEAIDARVVKSILQNSADKIPGWDNGQSNQAGIISTIQALDYDTGAGAMNLDRAFDQYTAGTTGLPGVATGNVQANGWDLASIDAGESADYTFQQPLLGGTTFTATLNWFVDYTYDYLADAEDILFGSFTDLDLAVVLLEGDTETVVAQSISTYSNTEHLQFTLPQTGDYAIRITYAGELFDFIGNNTESFGLAWNATAIPTPGVALTLLIALAPATNTRRRR